MKYIIFLIAISLLSFARAMGLYSDASLERCDNIKTKVECKKNVNCGWKKKLKKCLHVNNHKKNFFEAEAEPNCHKKKSNKRCHRNSKCKWDKENKKCLLA